jgi:hypothetical protein
MKCDTGQSLQLNCRIFCKFWSNLLTSVDNAIENNDCLDSHKQMFWNFFGVHFIHLEFICGGKWKPARDGTMSNQPRVAKVLAALLVSMTAGAIILMALGDNSPSAGVFSLSSRIPVQKAVHSRAYQTPGRWDRIEIYYSGTKAGNIEQLASLSGLASVKDINCHFVICNGLGGGDGHIQSTEKWQRQWSIIPGGSWYGSDKTIRVCVIADGKTAYSTDSQRKKAQVLVEELRRIFGIQAESVYYPRNWR